MLDYNKNINSRCVCEKGLRWIPEDLYFINDCEHILHNSCFKKLENRRECPICKTKITRIYTLKDLERKVLESEGEVKKEYYQKYVDLLSLSNMNDYGSKNLGLLIMKMPLYMNIFLKLPFISGFSNGHKACEDFLKLCNVKILVRGRKYLSNEPKVLILNHTTQMDFLISFYLFKCGYVASKIIADTIIGSKIQNIIPLVLIDRGKGQNTVKKIKEYIDKNKRDIAVYPEGIMTHPDTIIKFRTGSFHTGYPVQPIVVTYNPNISSCSDMDALYKMMSQKKETQVIVNILPLEKGPFDDIKIEKIRAKMAKAGNLLLSRVSNRDIKD